MRFNIRHANFAQQMSGSSPVTYKVSVSNLENYPLPTLIVAALPRSLDGD